MKRRSVKKSAKKRTKGPPRKTGDMARSRRAYEEFLALCKDADPNIPILQEAKAEYAKLK